MKRILPVILLLVAVAWLPIQLRRASSVGEAGESDDRLVVITPHNDSIRKAFGEAFAAHWSGKTGRSLYVDWRTPGGTAEVVRVIEAGFKAAERLGEGGTELDVFFGGGDYEFRKQAKLGHLAPLEVFDDHPEWFVDHIIPSDFSGESYHDPDERWVGVCVTQFGIIHNRDVVTRLGVPVPRQWTDLTNFPYFGRLAMADPTKSGSVTRAIEMMVQQQMQEVIHREGDTPAARARGWKQGMNLLQGLGANARYFTDSASKIPHDVAQGDAAAGLAIDFYGRSYEEKVRLADGTSRVSWIAPEGGTSLSVDPVAVFRGAPHGEVAQEFVRFCLSEEGQLLWNLKVGVEGGPRERALRRLPIRRDLYTPGHLKDFTDRDALPYERTGGFVYQPELTQKAFKALREIFRAMCMDPHEEMGQAWVTVHERGGSLDEFHRIDEIAYDRVMGELVPLLDGDDELAKSRRLLEISESFRRQYRAVSAKGGQP